MPLPTYDTLDVIRGRVSDLGYGAPNDSVDRAILATAKSVLASRRWPFLGATSSSLSLTAGTTSLSLAISDLVAVDSVRLLDGTTGVDLEHLELNDLRQSQLLDTTRSTPEYWSAQGTNLDFYPVPDHTYTVVVDYVALPAMPAVGSSGSVPFPAAYSDVLEWGAAKRLSFRQRDGEAFGIAAAEYTQALKNMVSAYSIAQRQTPGRVGKSDFWDNVAR